MESECMKIMSMNLNIHPVGRLFTIQQRTSLTKARRWVRTSLHKYIFMSPLRPLVTEEEREENVLPNPTLTGATNLQDKIAIKNYQSATI